MQSGLIIVSNRLPISVKKVDGKLEFYPSVGGLATGLSSYATAKNKWIGWPGIASDTLTERDRLEISNELLKHNCYPVFLTKRQLEDYYNGFSNSVLWPALHELPSDVKPLENWWRAYQRVNHLFAETVLNLSLRGGNIWVHDYQLLLLPAELRQHRPDDKIGFFLHIPWPKQEAFRLIPHAAELVGGLLGADLIGLHTEPYVENFLASCQQIGIGLVEHHKLILPDRVVRITDFPMGIDYGKYARATKQRAVKAELRRLKAKYGNKKVILTVDRLDPTKGLVERLQAYREFLRQNPSLRGKVVMVMVATPSRTEIPEYQALKRRLERLVREINKEFGGLRWQPVDYISKSLPFEAVSPLFQRADVAFIAPIIDGMNLVAKEYIASKQDSPGVLILSETAGAAQELRDAVLVNPHERESLVSGLSRALLLPPKELRRRAATMQDQLAQSTIHDWVDGFMKSLQQPVPGTPNLSHSLNPARQRELVETYHRASERLILLDYDGVLVNFRSRPAKAVPGSEVKRLLTNLSGQANTKVMLISGRQQADLEEWFGNVPGLILAAEHGAFIRPKGRKRWQMAGGTDLTWKNEVRDLLEFYAAKTPDAIVETKAASLVWHYRRASPYYAQKHLVHLKRLLARLAKTHDLVVEQGNMILEVRASNIDKGSAALGQITGETDFVLAIGDDATDEDMFSSLPAWAYTVKVGRGRSKAHYRLKNVEAVLALLKKLAK